MSFRITAVSLLALAAAQPAFAQAFNRIASFPVASNMAEGVDATQATSSEIIAATEDGMTLVYTDSPLGVLGRIDITEPANPQPLGNVELDGEPTSVAVIGQTAFVGVNTSESFTDPSGRIAQIDIESGEETASCDLGGQPDAVAKAPDGSFLAIAIENERDEDLNDGALPQMPAGALVIVNVAEGDLACDTINTVDLTGLAEVAPSDPEPEYVTVNAEGEIAVTLQENNHLVVVSSQGEILSHFSAGAVDLENIDATEDDALDFTESLSPVKREPDAAAWIDDTHFATANEGDYEGGSRGWTIWSQDGEVVYESGASFEHALIEIGHYPEGRSENKGVEPESVTFGEYRGTPMVFVGSERGSVVGIYDVTDPANPVLSQLLPSGIGPEGYVTIPSRDLLVSANEEDLVEDGGARAHVMLFEYQDAEPVYPMITSAGADEMIGWGALSGMVMGDDGMIRAVTDSFYAGQPSILTIDPAQTPARITSRIIVTRDGAPAEAMDLEGIALDGKGGFYLANEGRADGSRANAIWHVDAEGVVQDEFVVPEELTSGATNSGLEGVTVDGDGTIWAAVQREWADDPAQHVKLLALDPETGEWSAVHYPTEEPTSGGWVGLSEITWHDGALYLIERDNHLGQTAALKTVTRVDMAGVEPVALGGDYPVVEKTMVRDLMEDLTSTGGYVLDKVEGLAIAEDGTVWVSTDNDGVDDHSGETMFWSFQLD
ncbi:esterase-like activity of phytase family protein [Histidinibacterium aquaticum]|uniref:Esterase-like activity of phytase family protein n=1 Tax=Histidinibacterium aquaticum TaxID=2613962 RepID=A0A5J5GSD2_9RHOB|nr:esterase-like activity of phytase family protein [Histidinibacterium aquaticum]KAA9010488.1 esterase-like activity of phytase family protein [Histidinibacterium aquaticum]